MDCLLTSRCLDGALLQSSVFQQPYLRLRSELLAFRVMPQHVTYFKSVSLLAIYDFTICNRKPIAKMCWNVNPSKWYSLNGLVLSNTNSCNQSIDLCTFGCRWIPKVNYCCGLLCKYFCHRLCDLVLWLFLLISCYFSFACQVNLWS